MDPWSRNKKYWIWGAAAALAALTIALFVTASVLAKRWEPYIRVQAEQYLSQRFASEVQLGSISITLPKISSIRLFLTNGRGAVARVEASQVQMRYRGRRDLPPLFQIRRVYFEVDLGTIFQRRKTVRRVVLEGVDITIPPKGERAGLQNSPVYWNVSKPAVFIENVVIADARLVILPKDPQKNPLRFDIHHLRLASVGVGKAMRYDATLTNAVPPGEIQSHGAFGPWNAGEPGDTALSGNYDFDHADLGLFTGIAGILHSTGRFEGTLDSINATGEADVPDFRLKRAGNPVRLHAGFEVLVDGTNGNTVLQPVVATLGSTKFRTSGAVIKHQGQIRRSVELQVNMPAGNLPDLLRLAMKGPPFMEGRVALRTRIDVPPLNGDMREKLLLGGQFAISGARFRRPNFQDEIDTLSRRGQGQPHDQAIDDVVSQMKGRFQLRNEIASFASLSFEVPGADIALSGDYNLNSDAIDFHGTLRLKARLSQTMEGWKRWAFKPVDPFFAKDGAGTLLHVQVTGNAASPKFGLDHGDKAVK